MMAGSVSIRRIADWRMCLGCGACAYLGRDAGVAMRDFPEVGRRPVFPPELPEGLGREMAGVCPGARIESRLDRARAARTDDDEILIGPSEEIMEGWAADPEIRFRGSSGGVVTALACYCLERRGMALAVHTSMKADEPWLNETVVSRSRAELVARSGSRYSHSSPVELASAIEESDRPCVFIGKPCDAAAMEALRRIRPRLDERLGLVLSFFCAGAPSTSATLQLARGLGARDERDIKSLRYRGEGWPGDFKVVLGDGREARASYEESWGALSSRKRQLRCHLCPDGLGEMSDVSCGDAWHRKSEGTDGISIIVARTPRGKELLEAAIGDGYVSASPGSPARVVEAQGLIDRRKVVRARILALAAFGLPRPRFPGFFLDRAAAQAAPARRVREFLGMARRVILRGYLAPEPRR